MTAIDPLDPPPASELYPPIPMWVRLHVCECGHIGEYASTRCGRDRRTNMKASCPAIVVAFEPVKDE